MAIAYSYPTALPTVDDLLIGTDMASAGEDAPRTRTFTVGSIASLTGGTLQTVTTAGNLTNNRIYVQSNIIGDEGLINAIATGEEISGVYTYATTGTGIYAQTDSGTAIIGHAGLGENLLLTKSTSGNFIRLNKSGDDKLIVNSEGELTATKLIKTGGLSTEYLMADGNARVHTVTNVAQSTAFTLATLNSTYPTATIGFTVQCTYPSVLKSYQKTSTGWISYTIANVV